MKKATRENYALTHVKAYIYELNQYEEHGLDYMKDDVKQKVKKQLDEIDEARLAELPRAYWIADTIDDIIRNTNNFSEIKSFYKESFKQHYLDFIIPRIEGFYKAMVKTVSGLDYPEHSGTECRGWWRVFDEIKQTQGYFCDSDWGRDSYMAREFFKTKAITEQEYNRYVTRFTMNMIKSYAIDSDGVIDINKLPKVREGYEFVYNSDIVQKLVA